jgi:anti-sigma regulatory factor (Ser/Thr protein kinase)
VRADALCIKVRDHVRHAQAQESKVPLASQLRDGRTESVGLAVIQALMDTVEHRVDAHVGTELVMIKHVQV